MPHKDPAVQRAYRRRIYRDNPEVKRRHDESQKRWNEKHKATLEWYQDEMAVYRKQWAKADRLANPEKWLLRDFKQTLRGHGATLEWYQAKFKEQRGVCAICGRPETSVNVVNERTMRLAVDHAHHGAKRNRGLLCGTCNGALARLEVIEGWAEKALAYLKQYE
jgi:hypothetical protein